MGSLCFYLSFLLLAIVSVSELFVIGDSKTHPGDVKVLRDLKEGLDPESITPGSCLSSWDFSVDPCDHIFSQRFTCGIRCDLVVAGSNRVTEISLDQAGYIGSLSSSTWDLPYLQTLDVSNNSFSGSVPDSLSNLTRLCRLSLSRNLLSGEIPTSIGSLSSLEELYLDTNSLHGRIPSSFNGLISLKRLELQENKLSGLFPDLGSLRNLYFLGTSDNEFTGRVPASLPASLIELSMRSNNLEGDLPDSLGDLRSLQVMDLSHNRLSGSILSVLFNQPSLEQLTLSHNNLKSLQVPGNVVIQSKLIAVDLSFNELRGFLPVFMASMLKLSALTLEHNQFTGLIPSQYALKAAVPWDGTPPFERLLLAGNYLFGPIPGPLMGLKPGSVNVSLVDNCLDRCPDTFFFCQGGDQKSWRIVRVLGPSIPRLCDL